MLKGLHLNNAMTDIRAVLADNIKKRREMLCISQAILAERAETSTNYIAQIEQRKKFPSSEMIEKLAAALDLDSPELFATVFFKEEVVAKVKEAIYADMGVFNSAVYERLDEFAKYDQINAVPSPPKEI